MPIYERQRDRDNERRLLRILVNSLNRARNDASVFTFKTSERLHGFDACIYRRTGKDLKDRELYALVEATQRKVFWGTYPDVPRDKTKLRNMVRDAESYKAIALFVVGFSCGSVCVIQLSSQSLDETRSAQFKSDRKDTPDNVFHIPLKKFTRIQEAQHDFWQQPCRICGRCRTECNC